MSAQKMMQYKVVPRGMMIVMTYMAWRCAEWYMSLPAPSIEQSGFVSVVMGAMTGSFAIWMSHENKGIE